MTDSNQKIKAQQWLLTAVSEALGELKVPVSESLTVGRGQDNDLVLATKRVSRKHAELNVLNQHLYIKDLGSSNGTLINDEILDANKSHNIKVGDLISFAGLDFRAEALNESESEQIPMSQESEETKQQNIQGSLVVNNAEKEANPVEDSNLNTPNSTAVDDEMTSSDQTITNAENQKVDQLEASSEVDELAETQMVENTSQENELNPLETVSNDIQEESDNDYRKDEIQESQVNDVDNIDDVNDIKISLNETVVEQSTTYEENASHQQEQDEFSPAIESSEEQTTQKEEAVVTEPISNSVKETNTYSIASEAESSVSSSIANTTIKDPKASKGSFVWAIMWLFIVMAVVLLILIFV